MAAALLEKPATATAAAPRRYVIPEGGKHAAWFASLPRRMAEAVWSDLTHGKRLHRSKDDGGYTFRYAGRSYCLMQGKTATGRPARRWTITLTDASTEFPFTSDEEWTGRSRKDAVIALVTGVRGYPCPHQCITGHDSCTGCDVDDE